jgi:hypothetical protein
MCFDDRSWPIFPVKKFLKMTNLNAPICSKPDVKGKTPD